MSVIMYVMTVTIYVTGITIYVTSANYICYECLKSVFFEEKMQFLT